MTQNSQQQAPEVEQPLSREALLDSIQALKPKNPLEELAEVPEDPEQPQEELTGGEPAEAQEEDEGQEVREAALGRMSAADFAKATGITLEDLYRDVILSRDGKEVSISEMIDESKAHATALQALEQERTTLEQKLSQAQTAPPRGGMHPQAQALLMKAQVYNEAMQTTDWSTMEDGKAAKQQLEIQKAVGNLVQQAQAIEQQHQMALGQQFTAVREESDRQMRAAIPEWNDATLKAQEEQQIRDMAARYGYRAEEINAIHDPRARRMMRDLLKATQRTARINEGAKKLKKLSKTMESGSRQPERKPTQGDVRKKLRDPSLTREEAQRLRLTMPLGE